MSKNESNKVSLLLGSHTVQKKQLKTINGTGQTKSVNPDSACP